MLAPIDTLLALETGFRYEFSDKQFLRFALLGPMPTIRYAHPFGSYQMEITAATLGEQNVLQIDIRRPFGKK